MIKSFLFCQFKSCWITKIGVWKIQTFEDAAGVMNFGFCISLFLVFAYLHFWPLCDSFLSLRGFLASYTFVF